MSEIKLTATEIMQGALIGVMRQVQNLGKGRKHAHKASGNDWQMHVEGALGEMALAKHLSIYYGGVGVLRGDDVGEYQVRTTAGANNRLILHKDDPEDKWFWLLTGANGEYTVRGKILGLNGMKPEYWKDPTGEGRHAYFIPQSELEQE